MEIVELQSQVRSVHGKGAMHKLRSLGEIPGVVYGKGGTHALCQLHSQELLHKVTFPIRKNQLYRLSLEENGKSQQYLVFIKDWQLDPIHTHVWQHVDFYHVSETDRVRVSVPVEFVGKCKGEVDGGILQPICRELIVEALPTHIPEKITVSISDLGIGQTLHINDIAPLPHTTFHAPTNFAIVTVVTPQIEEEAKPVAEAAATPEASAQGKAPAATEAAPAKEAKETKEKKK